jgi:hypothetical protein
MQLRLQYVDIQMDNTSLRKEELRRRFQGVETGGVSPAQ